ncbi:MAG: NAD(+) synthase [Prevotellaceae bacterium]|nr:NAD(+) synthase [Prevotellaceae bacterium]
MKNFGYVKVGAAVPSVKVADIDYNVEHIKAIIDQAVAEGVEILVFPELCITGYTCQDLFRGTYLLDKSDEALIDLLRYCRDLPIVVIVGAPVRQDNRLFNAAVVLAGGTYYTVNKTYLPNYGEFYEKRWFSPEGVNNPPTIFELPSGVKFAIEVCEDMWSPLPPSSYAASAGADIIFNLSASDELIGKHQYLLSLISQQSARCLSAYVYSSAGFGESTQDVVYGGNAIIYENGSQLAHSDRFALDEQLVTAQIDIEKLRAERVSNTTFGRTQNSWAEKAVNIPLDVETGSEFVLERNYNPLPFIPTSADMQASCEEIFNIQVMGLAKRLVHTNCKNVVIGISGGLDSTLALLVCVKTFDKLGLDRKGIHGITMPGFGTTDRTHDNAVNLMTSLGITQREIVIADAVKQHFSDIGHDINNHDVTYENSQARYRTMLLMNIANQVGGMVIGTGDLSELALGWCTYNGDHMSMYAVNVSIPKTLIRYLVQYVAESGVDEVSRTTLLDVIDTPISPELIPADENGNIKQKTEDLVGPYELHDFFLYHFLRFGFAPAKIFLMAMKAFDGTNGPHYDEETIRKWLKTFMRRFFSQQFKRSCLPDGPKVGSVSLSPRGDWRMPSDAASKLWLEENY